MTSILRLKKEQGMKQHEITSRVNDNENNCKLPFLQIAYLQTFFILKNHQAMDWG